MAFYNSIYGLYGTDAMMHLVEEMRNAAEDAPVRYSFSKTITCLNVWLTMRCDEREPWSGP